MYVSLDSNVIIKDSQITFNSAFNGGCFYILGNSVFIANSDILSNAAENAGSVAYLTGSDSIFEAKNTAMENNVLADGLVDKEPVYRTAIAVDSDVI